jgi:dihydrofolate reductase
MYGSINAVIMNIQISQIVAMTRHRVIGYQNKMPWHLPAELHYFKTITLNKTIIMGRKTFASIAHPLPHRHNIVLSKQHALTIPGCEVYADLETALKQATLHDHEEIMIIGGASLFIQTLPLAQRLYLTVIDANLPGDTFFPEFDVSKWHIISKKSHPADDKNLYAFQTEIWERG